MELFASTCPQMRCGQQAFVGLSGPLATHMGPSPQDRARGVQLCCSAWVLFEIHSCAGMKSATASFVLLFFDNSNWKRWSRLRIADLAFVILSLESRLWMFQCTGKTMFQSLPANHSSTIGSQNRIVVWDIYYRVRAAFAETSTLRLMFQTIALYLVFQALA
eukprot:2888161-Amphidinium_carterae.1